MDAPKKIWANRGGNWFDTQSPSKSIHETPYIRADLVDGLVEALEHIEQYEYACRYIKGVARAALKALEENNE